MADAIGTQTEAIAVRGLSLSRIPFKQLLFGELRTGSLIGLVLGLTTLPFVTFVYHDFQLGIAVSVAIFVAGAMATTVGLLLPWALSKCGKDPALGAGPVGTVIQDVISLVVYFMTAQLIVR